MVLKNTTESHVLSHRRGQVKGQIECLLTGANELRNVREHFTLSREIRNQHQLLVLDLNLKRSINSEIEDNSNDKGVEAERCAPREVIKEKSDGHWNFRVDTVCEQMANLIIENARGAIE
ncbi:unnamed protein product [Soboliphyme baturini]|uniref:Uncharacterized protein n=1 Tax=Soboliphyme baturini TaxID=241478 RepID=A0A183J7V7_9BILA|nr:unnamed protein product [Soboliphyme baturini]